LLELRAVVERFVVLPDEHALNAVTLWIAATHLQPQFHHAPRLAITGPQKRCGKSRLLDVVHATVHHPILTVNASSAAIFRSIGAEPPTLLVDEADTIFNGKGSEQTEQLRGLLNAGHQRGRNALRVGGKDMDVQEFQTFAMAALAGIGDLPDTVMDRAVVVRMRRRMAGEHVDSYRSRDADALQPLNKRLAAWAASVAERAGNADPAMPVADRAADTWEPLVVVADLAAGPWPHLARAACQAMTAREAARPQEEDYSARLLVDIHAAFAAAGDPEVLPTARLIALLCADEESPWPTYMGKGLGPRHLQLLLREYEVGSKNYRLPEGQRKGFARTQFLDTWARYSPHILTTPNPTTLVTPATPEPQPTAHPSPPAALPQRRAPAPPPTAAEPRTVAALHRSPTLPTTAPTSPATPAPPPPPAAPQSPHRR
jgi:hypothetical protein